MDKAVKIEYRDKLKRYLATPHSTKALFEEYQQENSGMSFDEYTKKIEDLLDKLDEGKIETQSQLCESVKALKLPTNQFGC